MSLKYRLYQALLKTIHAKRENMLLQKLDLLAKGYHLAYENLNYDCQLNGEYFLANKLYSMNNLHCVIDVGANIGDYSKLIRSLSDACQIFAFEPVPSTFKDLVANTASAEVETINCALGNFVGKSEINLVPNSSELASLVENMQEAGGRECAKIEISVTKGEQLPAIRI
ncbi:MAG: FkbM family methyltransferase [Cyanobacteriota bacterium]